jgi:hypothetical protein
MLLKLGQNAQKRWQRIRGYRQLLEVIQGVKLKDGASKNEIFQQEAA